MVTQHTHTLTHTRCRNQIPCGVLLYGDLLRIFTGLLLRLSEASQMHLIHPLTHSHTLHRVSEPSPRCSFPPPPAVTLIIYRSLIFHSFPLFNIPLPQPPSTLFQILCSFRLLSSHYPFFYLVTLFFPSLHFFLSATCLLFSYCCFLPHPSLSHGIKPILFTSVNHIYICYWYHTFTLYHFRFKRFRPHVAFGSRLQTLITFNCECVNEWCVPWTGYSCLSPSDHWNWLQQPLWPQLGLIGGYQKMDRWSNSL